MLYIVSGCVRSVAVCDVRPDCTGMSLPAEPVTRHRHCCVRCTTTAVERARGCDDSCQLGKANFENRVGHQHYLTDSMTRLTVTLCEV